MAYTGYVSHAQAWQDLKDMIERGDITDKDNQTIHVSDLQRAMSDIELDNRD